MMFKPYGRKKRIKILFNIIILIAILMYIFSIFYKNQDKNDAAAKIGSYRINNSEIINKYNEILGGKLDENIIDVNKIPDQVKKSIAKEVFIEKQIIKKANKIAIHRDKRVKDKIKAATNRILVDEYIKYVVDKATSEKNILNEYKNMVNKRDGKQEVLIDKITLDKEDTHKIIYKKLKLSNKLPLARFAYFKKYYSTEKNYKPQLILEQDLPFKLTNERVYEVRDDNGLQIYLVKEVEKAKVPEFDDALKEKIKYDIYQKAMKRLIDDIMKNQKITILKYAN